MGELDTAETMPATEAAPDRTRDSLAFRDDRARDAIVDAMLGLYHRGVPDPTALEIADQAGVSLRSVYYHFADLESLAIEAVGRQRAQIEPLLIIPITTGTLDDRITETVERRCELYEVVTPVRRAALLIRHRSPTIDENLALLAKVLREQLASTFAPELAAADERGGRGVLLDALDLATSWEAWEQPAHLGGADPRPRPRGGPPHPALAARVAPAPAHGRVGSGHERDRRPLPPPGRRLQREGRRRP